MPVLLYNVLPSIEDIPELNPNCFLNTTKVQINHPQSTSYYMSAIHVHWTSTAYFIDYQSKTNVTFAACVALAKCIPTFQHVHVCSGDLDTAMFSYWLEYIMKMAHSFTVDEFYIKHSTYSCYWWTIFYSMSRFEPFSHPQGLCNQCDDDFMNKVWNSHFLLFFSILILTPIFFPLPLGLLLNFCFKLS